MPFVKIGSILPSVGNRTDDPSAFNGMYVVETIQREIGLWLGEKAIGNVRAKSFKDGVLVLSVSSSVWASFIHSRNRFLLYKCNEILKTVRVRKITTVNNGAVGSS